MLEPDTIDVATPAVQLRVLSWGPEDAPIALCLHGFPDTAYGWRKVAPMLVDAGWRVVAPFMRGYAPSSLPKDGSYHVGALMDDALRVLDAAGATGRDVIIGHDWGAMAGAGLAAMPDSPFTKAVIMSVPPSASFRPPAVGFPMSAASSRHCRRSCCEAGTSCTSNCPGCQNVPPNGSCRGCGGNGHPDIAPTRISATSKAAIGAPDRWRAALGLLPRGRAQYEGAGAVRRAARALAVCAEDPHALSARPRRRLCHTRLRALGARRCCRMAARWRSSTAPGTSCNSNSPTSSLAASSNSWGRRARPSSTPDDCGQPSATTVAAAGDG